MSKFKELLIKVHRLVVSTVLPDQNTKKWRKLKDKFKGKRIFLIGNGPSLNETPLYLLKNDIALCFNRFSLLHERLNWMPTFFMCIDPEVLPDISNDINANLDSYKYAMFHSLHADNIDKKDNVYFVHPPIRIPFFSKGLLFSDEPPIVGAGGTVAYIGLQMLYYLGFAEVYLIGVDQNYVIHTTAKTNKGIKIESQHDDDPNHFDPRYFGKGRKYHQPVEATQIKMIKAFERAKEAADSKGVVVKNAGVGGMLEVFDRVKIEDLFDYSEDTVYQLFCEAISEKCSVNKVKDLIRNGVLEEAISEDIEKDMFLTNRKDAKKFIPKLITRYIPYGPIEDKYIFINRNGWNETVTNKLADI